MMASRISCPSHVFDCFMEVCGPKEATENKPFILQKYPRSFKNSEIMKSVPQFCYPCEFETSNVMHFSFVLTSFDSKWSFGFIRHPPHPGETCLVLISSLPWHDTFYKVLNYIASLIAKDKSSHLNQFLEALYKKQVPQPGLVLHVEYYVNDGKCEFSVQCPDHHKIPSIPEDRNSSEYFSAVDSNNMIIIFASMLNERRILITSNKLSRLSACVQAANSLIYPMFWQHIFIPVLPSHLLDYLSAPMPFLIGVPTSTLKTLKHPELGEVVVLDADDDKITSPFDDIGVLPNEVVSFLRRNLRSQGSTIGDGVSRTFLKALVMLIGGYRDALRFNPGEKITFDSEAFIKTRPPHMQPFLQKMLHLQIFHQFIEDRLRMLNDGEGFSDEFEFELNMYEDRSSHRLRTQYKEWLGAMKKEGGAFLKSVNSAKNSAIKRVKNRGKQVKDKSRRAYQDLRLKFQDTSKPEGLPRSAPSSPQGSPPISSHIYNVKKRSTEVDLHQRNHSIMFPMDQSQDPRKTRSNPDNQIFPLSDQEGSQSSDQAPDISSEDSEPDSIKDGLIDDGSMKKGVYADLMSDFQEVVDSYETKLKLNDRRSSNNHIILPSYDRPPNISTNAIVPPPPPPSRPHKNKNRSESKTDESLIKLDSSPEDFETLFDPLKQKSSNFDASLKHANDYSSQLESSFLTHNLMNQSSSNKSFVTSFNEQPFTHHQLSSSQLPNQISSNLINNSNQSFYGVTNSQGRPSFLHDSLRNLSNNNGAFHASFIQPKESPTNPFYEPIPQHSIIPSSCDSDHSAFLASSSGTMISPFPPRDRNPLKSNWQQFE
ncbi:DENN domain-containing protein 1B-like isoform X2 [Brevipalpus obovatus]|uniref:DENN domain-containing protein 1B-like isoform X2 n=1 Tax=Brevipalpus obovatus TaxID=246614 RepID=UPI003D9F7BD1